MRKRTWLVLFVTVFFFEASSQCGFYFENFFGSFQKIRFWDEINGVIIADKGTMLVTQDGGTTWRRQTVPLVQSLYNNPLRDICIADNSYGYAVGSFGMILKTTDKGRNWKRLIGTRGKEQFSSVSFWNKSEGIIVDQDGNIIKTIDGGDNWKPVSSPGAYFFTGVYFINAAKGFVWGDNKVFVSTDSAKTWQESNGFPDTRIFNMQFLSATTGFYNSFSGYSKIYSTTDGGQTWVDKVPAFSAPNFQMGSFFIDEQTGYFGSTNVIYKTINGGTDFIDSYQFNLGSYRLTDIFFVNRNTGYAVGKANQYVDGYGRVLFKTTNAGASWTVLDYSFEANTQSVLKVSPSRYFVFAGNDPTLWTNDSTNTWNVNPAFDDGTGYRFGQQLKTGELVVINDNFLFTSDDNGSNWSEKPLNLPANTYKFSLNPVNWFARDSMVMPVNTLTGEKLLITMDGTASWETIDLPAGFTLSQYRFFSVDTGYIGGIGDHPTVFRTTDRGLNWEQVFNPDTVSNTFFKSQFVNDSTIVIVAGNYPRRCYKSTDRGDHWSEVPMPYDPISSPVYVFDFFDDQKGIVATVDGYVFITKNSGRTWELQLNSLVNSGIINGVKFLSEEEQLVYGQGGRCERLTPYIPAKPSVIKGPVSVLKDSIYEYIIPLDIFSFDTYWEVTGNGQMRYDSTAPDRILARWPEAGNYKVIAYSKSGCGNGQPFELTVNVYNSPTDTIPVEPKEILLFPVPANNTVNIRLPVQSNYKLIRIYSMTGAMIHQRQVSGNTMALDVSTFAAGMYILQFYPADGSKPVLKRIIVK